jgi:hypothetical protein
LIDPEAGGVSGVGDEEEEGEGAWGLFYDMVKNITYFIKPIICVVVQVFVREYLYELVQL